MTLPFDGSRSLAAPDFDISYLKTITDQDREEDQKRERKLKEQRSREVTHAEV